MPLPIETLLALITTAAAFFVAGICVGMVITFRLWKRYFDQ